MQTVFSTIFQNRYFPVYILAGLVLLASCKGDDGGDNPTPDELTAQQERARDLVGTWASDDANITSPDDTEDAAQQELEALTMTFAVNNSTDYAPAAFSSAGADTYFNDGSGATWAWANATTTTDVNLTTVAPVSSFSISNFDGSTMTITFNFAGASTGRFSGIGAYSIQMTKQ